MSRRHGLFSALGWTLGLLGAAYVVVTSPAAMRHNADSILPVFVSLEAWSLFYWGQDRFGMLIPLLATPVRDSFTNLIVQGLLTVVIFLAGSVAVFARLGVPRPRLAALLVVTILVICCPRLTVFMFFTTNQSYAPALGCFGLALYVARREGALATLGAFVLMIVGTWTNGGVGLFAALTALMLVLAGFSRERVVMLIGAVVALGCHAVLQRFATSVVVPTRAQWPAIGEVPILLAWFWVDAFVMIGWPLAIVCLLLWTAAAIQARRAADDRQRRDLIAVAVAVLSYGVIMAILLQGLGRHMLAVVPLLVAAPLVCLLKAPPLEWLWRSRLTVVVVLAALVVPIGIRKPATVRRALITELGGGHAIQMYTHGVNVITGEYWDAWQLAFTANMIYEQRDGRRPVVPVAMRSEPLAGKLAAALRTDAKVAIFPAGHLVYWHQRGTLPHLTIVEDRQSYSLAVVSRDPTAPRPAR